MGLFSRSPIKLFRFVPLYADPELMLIKPTPVKEHVPEWYRLGEFNYTVPGSDEEHPGLKTCVPFLDVMLCGYVLLTPFDIFVGRNDDGTVNIRWNGPQEWAGFIDERPKELGATIPRPAGHAPNGLVWASRWGWKTPRGWSTVVTHPYNRHDLPFTTLAGLIDSDKFMANGNIPMFIKEDFVGVIPAGTPYAQITPFKRVSQWKMVCDFGLVHGNIEESKMIREKSYKKYLWVRKKFD
jgi:hypothetical protein